MQRPPPGVKLVIEAVCIMKGIKPKKVPGEKPGTKVDDYWEPGKGLLQDPGRFLESLFKFDKVSMPGTLASQQVRTRPARQDSEAGEEPAPPQHLHVQWPLSRLSLSTSPPPAPHKGLRAMQMAGTRARPQGVLSLRVTDPPTERY